MAEDREAKDPVCEMLVREAQAQSKGLTSNYQGGTYFFCCPGCKADFDADPDRYAGRDQEKH